MVAPEAAERTGGEYDGSKLTLNTSHGPAYYQIKVKGQLTIYLNYSFE